MSPEKEKQKKQFKKKKKKRRKIKNMKGMITSFIIAFLIITAFCTLLYLMYPVFSDENTLPVSGTVISVTRESRRLRYQSKTWVVIELDNGETYEIAPSILNRSGWSRKDLQSRILYKTVTIRYPNEKIPRLSLFRENGRIVFLSDNEETLIDYATANQMRTSNMIGIALVYICLLSFTEFCIWVTYGKHRVG